MKKLLGYLLLLSPLLFTILVSIIRDGILETVLTVLFLASIFLFVYAGACLIWRD